MKKTIALLLCVLTLLPALTFFSFADPMDMTITVYGTGMENWNNATQILICPKVAGNWTNELGVELQGMDWELTLTKKGTDLSKTVLLKPSSIYPANTWGIIRFTPCLAEGKNRFIPEKNAEYTLSVRVFDEGEPVYAADGGSQVWKLTLDPIRPDDSEVLQFTWEIKNGVLKISGSGQSVGASWFTAEDYPWYSRRSEVTSVEIAEGIVEIGAHAFEDMPALAQIRVGSTVEIVGDCAFSQDPLLKRIYFAGLPEEFGQAVAADSTALASVVLADHGREELRLALAQSPQNLASAGQQALPFDRASVHTVYVEGVWKGVDGFTQDGYNMKRWDANKDGVFNIVDVTTLLDFLADGDIKWAGSFYDVNNSNSTNITDVTVLLNNLSMHCSHVLMKEDELPATCTENGHTLFYACEKCATLMTQRTEYESTGHTIVTDRPVAATCGSDGLTAGSHCKVCGEVFEEQTVVARTGAHTYAYAEALAPTCGKDGYSEGQVCTVCGDVLSGHEILPATGAHTLVTDEPVPAGCLVSGLTQGSHCTTCGKAIVAQEVIPAQGHEYRNDRCVYCGKADFALLKGKTALFTGDSLCAASTYDKDHQWWGWAGRINKTYELKSYRNSGVDGASVSNCRNTNTIIRQINNARGNTFDYVLLEGGTNDGWDTVTVGTMTEGTAAQAVPANFDLSTFAGGLENLFYYTKTYFPTAKIGYIFTHKMNSNTGTLRNMSAYLAVAKQICQKWDIPMLNVDESPDFAVRYFAGISSLVPDGIHPSSEGYELLYPVIARFMAEITLNDSYAEYVAEIETEKAGPSPYAPIPDKDEDPQGWVSWLLNDYGEATPLLESGSAYTRAYNADGKQHLASAFEYWSGHYQFCYVFSKDEIDLMQNVGRPNYGYVWELWYKDADRDEPWRCVRTAPWSVYEPSAIYRIDVYDQGMNDLCLDEGSNRNQYELVIVIYDAAGEMVGWKKDVINYTDSSELFLAEALEAGAVG